MRVRLITVSERQPDWVNSAFADYAKRLPKHLQPQLVELPLAKRREDVLKAKADEGLRILDACKDAQLIALDERGKALSSRDLAGLLPGWEQSGRDIALVVGGPDGLDASVLQRAALKWSLSALTLPHGMVRVILAEQMYRAWSIQSGHPYHRD
ncbi:23S rRNA (pseudouridine(1915)-N(3))-methyltransferase RlmH [Ahniella affigens]|uniref:Ribosomal RNA large subunit methyltransferase H n=1 Tax=Ahniella affigens TaxID=2021234 RepID=A0A2P1PLN5_9GAMM|nr:23S rRNA (pseudouridine(1915)-N(3))-methyltransferase RlmH [Ahniella affigens]AVP95751.1 23S rRNA (pseudouridine(1915)-N(3))-methyltransferase RlmH [Ahniella affigens]